MKSYIIPIFIPHYGCHHNCVFCNQQKITGIGTTVTPEMIEEILTQHFTYIKRPRLVEAAFYGGSFTAIPIEQQCALLRPVSRALSEGKIEAIRVSTRPDSINSSIIQLLKEHQVSTVELGVQSLDDKVLKTAERGHNSEDVVQAVQLIKRAGLTCGIQLMPGLPGEDWQSLLLTGHRAVGLGADFARIYPTVVITGTKLADMYRSGVYEPLSLSEAVKRAAFLKLHMLQHGIKVIRTGLQATKELSSPGVVLDGPYHPAFGEMVDSYLFYNMGTIYFEQQCLSEKEVSIHHHPLDHSKIRGQANFNLINWKNKYGLTAIQLHSDGVRRDEIMITDVHGHYLINMMMLLNF